MSAKERANCEYDIAWLFKTLAFNITLQFVNNIICDFCAQLPNPDIILLQILMKPLKIPTVWSTYM